MFRWLPHRVRAWPAKVRRRIVFHWLAREKDGLGFFTMLSLPAVALGSIIFFAYSDRPRVTERQVDAARQREVDLQCLAENIYYEARGEPLDGQYAVAEVT